MNSRGPIWKISITTSVEAEDAVTELLFNFIQLPVSSYTDVETCAVTVAAYLPWERRRLAGKFPTISRILSGDTSTPPALRTGLQQIKACGLNIGSGKISIQKIRREDWAESWKRHFKPIEIGSALLIKPSWSKRPAKKTQAVIVLDPGLSFGTGQHPTTAFCLQQLASRSSLITHHSSLSLLDIGTGSGILAIAAAKLSFTPVDAFDFDPEAVRIARENARKNRVLQKVHITRGDVTKLTLRCQKKHDVICANLISTLLVAEHSRILCRLKEDGILVLAGILKTEFPSVQTVYERAGLRLIASRVEKEWRSGAFTYRRHR